MLNFDIEQDDLQQIADKLGATPKQVKYSLHRALRRTEATLRKMSSKGLTRELALRMATVLRKRLRSIKLRTMGNNSAIGLWYGLNDLPVSSFKGRPKQADDYGGAFFNDYYFKGGFVAHSQYKGKKTIFKRKGEARLPIVEQMIAIEDRAIVFIEDEIFSQLDVIFWNHFRRDLQARVNYQLGER